MPLLTAARRRVLPGFAPTLGFTLFYLSLIVLVPLAASVGTLLLVWELMALTSLLLVVIVVLMTWKP